MTVRTGDVLLPRPRELPDGPIAEPRIGTLDARNAAAQALAAFLVQAVFRRGGGDDIDTEFGLEAVQEEWPDPAVQAVYPSASIVDAGAIPYQEHSLTPTALEETWGCFGDGTVLWKTAEAVCSFQVDYWCVHDSTREAIAASLPRLFNPGEERTGVVLAGPAAYYCRPVRATLETHQRMDTPGGIYTHERRLRTIVRCEVDVVYLRCDTLLAVEAIVADVGEQVELETEPAAESLDIGCDTEGS